MLYAGLKQITATVNEVWTPDYIALNHIEKFEKDIRHDLTELYLYGDSGGVYWSRPAVIRLSCHPQAALFPYDTQQLQINMSGWSMSGHLQDLQVMPYTTWDGDKPKRVTDGTLDMSIFAGSAEYEVVPVPARRLEIYYACCPDEAWPTLVFALSLVRKPHHYVVNIIVPTAVTTAVSFSSFYLPHDCGERLGLGITCMLVITAIMMVSGDLMPITDGKTILGSFYTGCFLYTLMSLLGTVLSSALIAQDGGSRDHEWKGGTYFITRVFGIKTSVAVQLSYRVDFYMGLLCPVSFVIFTIDILNPFWGWRLRLAAGLLSVVAIFGILLVLVGLLHALYWILGVETYKLSLVNIACKWLTTAASEVNWQDVKVAGTASSVAIRGDRDVEEAAEAVVEDDPKLTNGVQNKANECRFGCTAGLQQLVQRLPNKDDGEKEEVVVHDRITIPRGPPVAFHPRLLTFEHLKG
eukprot:TRINITY_DN6311_c0_g2_i2.p1 TRINITY_DN6311_c0_g2~~TRINITY_DN6311_c0_g2_i2.p1  ORF type:complete len:466 (+),score=40.20 TRINITY_DN6311_c0_g2_i2:120-1517(+)